MNYAYQEGYNDGYREGYARGMSDLQQQIVLNALTLKNTGDNRKVDIDRVLEIIDGRIEHHNPVSTLLQARAVSELNYVKHDILALKG